LFIFISPEKVYGIRVEKTQKLLEKSKRKPKKKE